MLVFTKRYEISNKGLYVWKYLDYEFFIYINPLTESLNKSISIDRLWYELSIEKRRVQIIHGILIFFVFYILGSVLMWVDIVKL